LQYCSLYHLPVAPRRTRPHTTTGCSCNKILLIMHAPPGIIFSPPKYVELDFAKFADLLRGKVHSSGGTDLGDHGGDRRMV
jgi:hypothetical protein